jgi:hypothetical protein
VDVAVIEERPELAVSVIGERRAARILPEAAYDPQGSRARG